MNKLAQINLFPEGKQFEGFGPLGKPEDSGIGTFTDFMTRTIGLMTIIAVIWFVFVIITGAIGIISSGGDKAAYESARKRITTGLIGFVAVIAAIFILDLIGTLFDIPFLNLGELFGRITKP